MKRPSLFGPVTAMLAVLAVLATVVEASRGALSTRAAKAFDKAVSHGALFGLPTYATVDLPACTPLLNLAAPFAYDMTAAAAKLCDGSTWTTAAFGQFGGTVPGQIAYTGNVSPASITADQNDYAGCTVATKAVCRVTGDSSFRTITGLAGGSDGITIFLHNIGSNSILLANQNTGSTAANRFDFGGYDVPLWPSGSIKLQYDSTSSRWRADTTTRVIPPARLGFYSLFGGLAPGSLSATDWNAVISGAAATFGATNGTVGHPAVESASTGTTTTGRTGVFFHSNGTGYLFLGNSWYWRYETAIRLTTLSDGTETYTFRAGFLDSFSAEATDGVLFRYTHSVNSGNWQGACIANAVETTLNSSSAVAAATYYRLTILINPAGSTAEFFVNGTSIGTCGTTIPTAAGRETSAGLFMLKSAGTTARLYLVDFIEVLAYAGTPN